MLFFTPSKFGQFCGTEWEENTCGRCPEVRIGAVLAPCGEEQDGFDPTVVRSGAFWLQCLQLFWGPQPLRAAGAGQTEDRLSPHVGSLRNSSSVFLLLLS